MKILLVAMSNSIHTARWVAQIANQGWDIHLFPSVETYDVHEDLRNITIHRLVFGKEKIKDRPLRDISLLQRVIGSLGKRVMHRLYGNYRAAKLSKLISRLKPDIVHSLEFQAAGYLTLEAKQCFEGVFPPWIATNWGSDIYLFGRLIEHQDRIKELLAQCTFYACECFRDVKLAKDFGFKGQVLPVFPNTGGFDLDQVAQLRLPGPTSQRRIIMLKGYQGWAGRALVGLRALERCAELLKGYSIYIYSAAPEVELAAQLFAQSTGIPVNIIPKGTHHADILRLHGEARISIGLSISDGISTSLLETLVMGSFPIQSFTACADEWIIDGRTGILVHPEDPDLIENALRLALSDDCLVDQAAEENYLLAAQKLDHNILRPRAIDIYKTVHGTKEKINGS